MIVNVRTGKKRSIALNRQLPARAGIESAYDAIA